MKEQGEKKIYAGTAKNNLPSVGLLNSVGFQLVGTERISFHKDSEGTVLSGILCLSVFCDGGKRQSCLDLL